MKKRPLILVVDDQIRNIEVLKTCLNPNEYNVITALSGLEALEKLSENPIDLILLDVLMPDMNGFEVIRLIRQNNSFRLLPIILITVLHKTEDRVKGLEAGCDDFISRPFEKIEVLARIRSLLKLKAYNDLLCNYRIKLEAITKSADEARQFAESIINTVREPLVVLDHDLRVISASRSFYRIFQVESVDTIGQRIYDLGNKQWDIPGLRELLKNICTQKKSFEDYEVDHDFTGIGRRVMLLNARPIENSTKNKKIILLAIEDITERKKSEGKILQMAFHDSLTGLPNRKLFSDRMDYALLHAERNKKEFGIAMVDLDKFKNVNDTLGHDSGDVVLKAAAQRLGDALRKEDTVARLGGDEFVLIFPDLEIAEDAAIIVQKIVDQFQKPFLVDNRQLQVTTSIGVAVYPTDGTEKSVLLKHADIAMYEAKQAGRDRYRFYQSA